MFVILLNYVAPIEEIDKALIPHREFLDKYYSREIFICSGAQNPRTGGLILAKGVSRNELESIVKEDPFNSLGLAEYSIIEFTPTKFLDKFKDLKD